jgi:hypothetical protein
MDRVTEYASAIYDHELTPKIVALAVTTLTLLLIICLAFKAVGLEKRMIRKARGEQEGLVGGAGQTAEYSFQPLLFADPHGAGRPLMPAGLAKLQLDPEMPAVVENVPFDARWVANRAGWAYGPLTGDGHLYDGF